MQHSRREPTNSATQPFDRSTAIGWLRDAGVAAWAGQVEELVQQRYSPAAHGDWPKWTRAIESLPPPETAAGVSVIDGAVSIVRSAESRISIDSEGVPRSLMRLHPWRKGPFRFFEVYVDTEWRSDWKWSRIEQAVDWTDRTVLDVGCGNGYYGWRMLDRGARAVIGGDPLLLYNAQFEAVRRYWRGEERHWVLPLKDTEIAPDLRLFDIVVSMGVLYHRPSPIEHLMLLRSACRPGGTVLLETLVVEDTRPTVLVPQDRYAKMRNVWFIPSPPMMEIWLHRCGYRDIRLVDVSPTMVEEQRQTEWMQFESLADFLSPEDPTRTIEGYPAPVRGIWRATA
ncbi:MAG: tRNA 5-methoxyuridine(34)/uridine 5-oxyacetic acid(34) synthase CmoB [Planctomycetota bacterium]|nr:MAG: tRNA 5-methoxyuridine(34)/uridine 5-oxyacetic acid(34) synthase CmoB [Planctomycetota bacterium]